MWKGRWRGGGGVGGEVNGGVGGGEWMEVEGSGGGWRGKTSSK